MVYISGGYFSVTVSTVYIAYKMLIFMKCIAYKTRIAYKTH